MQSGDLEQIESQTIIVTSTLYGESVNDNKRADLAKLTIAKATDLGYQIITADGGSPDSLLHAFERMGAVVIAVQTGTMTGDRKMAVHFAEGTAKPFFAWTEPEKYTYIDQIPVTVRPLIYGGAELVVPRRGNLAGYPQAQQLVEPLGNLIWKQLTDLDLDMWFGPRTWKRELNSYFLTYDESFGSSYEGLYLPIIDIVRDGHAVTSVNVEYIHPPEQSTMD